MLSVGRCGVARLQMKYGHMDGMHCIIDITSILVKIKSVALYNCRTVYHTHTSIRSPLKEGSARRRGRYLHDTQQATNVQALGGIRTFSPSIQAAAVLRLRLHGHRDVICVVNSR